MLSPRSSSATNDSSPYHSAQTRYSNRPATFIRLEIMGRFLTFCGPLDASGDWHMMLDCWWVGLASVVLFRSNSSILLPWLVLVRIVYWYVQKQWSSIAYKTLQCAVWWEEMEISDCHPKTPLHRNSQLLCRTTRHLTTQATSAMHLRCPSHPTSATHANFVDTPSARPSHTVTRQLTHRSHALKHCACVLVIHYWNLAFFCVCENTQKNTNTVRKIFFWWCTLRKIPTEI